ncbi:phosphoribosylglycinamide formyltransferase [Cuniculiplasma sp. SKW4]|uniref:phosphoribosylglycinamide formyltransferase n=1 Tax=Cuniculiplasma sp. SKW4 TaxID=3400171 RepID=UPI003FD6751A
MKKIAVFASGSGTTFRSIVEYSIKKDSSFKVSSLVTDRKNCGAVQIASDFNIHVIEYNQNISDYLMKEGTDLIVLAGFLKIIGKDLIENFPERIVNIHPSLLPSFGGMGYYGIRVHRAVKGSGVKYTGFTVHYVNGNVDGGKIIYQDVVPVMESDTPEDIEKRVHGRELEMYPRIIDAILRKEF